MSTSFLQKMKDLTIERVEEAKRLHPREFYEDQLHLSRQPFDFLKHLQAHQACRVIAEVKRQSPSRGDIAPLLDPVKVAQAYERAGAVAISVLTEPHFFGGSLQILQAIRKALPNSYLLRKDFLLDPYQLLEARFYGADAVLLIHSFLKQDELKSLYQNAIDLRLTPLVEVHSEAELQSARSMGARLIGVNSRDLTTLNVDTNTFENLAKDLNDKALFLIAESGIESAAQMKKLEAFGYCGFLIGTQLMKDQNPESALQTLLKEMHESQS